MKKRGFLAMSKGVGLRDDLASAFSNSFFNDSVGNISSSSGSEDMKEMVRGGIGIALILSVFDSDLPEQEMFATFQFLNLADLYSLMLTSKKYFRLARDNEVWENRAMNCVSRFEKLSNMNLKKENNPFYWFQCSNYFFTTSRYSMYPPKTIFLPKSLGSRNDDSESDELKKMIEFHYPFRGLTLVTYIVAISESYIRLYDSNKRNLAKEIYINEGKNSSSNKKKGLEKLYNAYQMSDWALLTFSSVEEVHRIRVWDLRTMECSRILSPEEKKSEQVTEPYFYLNSLDRQRLLACSRDHFVGIWNIEDGTLDYSFRGSRKNFLGYYLLSDREKLVVGVQQKKGSITDVLEDAKHQVNIFDLKGKEFYSELLVNSKKPILLFAELEGKFPQKIVLVKDNGREPKMQVWNIAGSRVYEMRGGGGVNSSSSSHEGKIMGLMFLERKETLFSISKDTTIRMWSMKRGHYKCVKVMKYVRPMIKIFEMKNRRICTVSSKGDWKILVWDHNKGVCEAGLDPKIDKKEEDRLISVIELPSGKICSCDTQSKIKIWDWEYDASHNASSWSFD